MVKDPSIQPASKRRREFTRHYHRRSAIKSRVSSKRRTVLDLEQKEMRKRLLLLFTLLFVLGGILFILLHWEQSSP